MSNLSIGLITSPSEESQQLISMLQALDIQVLYHIAPEEINSQHIEDANLNVWLLNVDDDHWHDNIDLLLDESDASIYFNEPGTLNKQAHPEYWCSNLANRLYELTGIKKQAEVSQTKVDQSANDDVAQASVQPTEQPSNAESEIKPVDDSQVVAPVMLDESIDLSSALDELELSSIGLSSDVAAEIVSELESISPDLEVSLGEPIMTEEVIAEKPEIQEPIIEEPLVEKLIVKDSVVAQKEPDEILLEDISEEDHRSFEQLMEVDLSEDDNLAVEVSNDSSIVENTESVDNNQDGLALDAITLDDIELDDFELDQLGEVSHQRSEVTELEEIKSEETELDISTEEVKPQDELSFETDFLESESESKLEIENEFDLSTEIESKEALSFESSADVSGVSDELLELANQSDVLDEDSLDDDSISLVPSEPSFAGEINEGVDEIDFSNFEMPVLESAREDDQTILQSTYDIGDNEKQTSQQTQSNEDDFSAEDIPMLDDDELSLDDGFDLELEPTVDESSVDSESFEPAVSIESNLSLEEINVEPSEPVVHGRASFIEEEPVEETEQLVDSNMDELDALAGLSLESVEEEKVTGKAIFVEPEAEPEQIIENDTVEESTLADDGGLSLESVGDAMPSGKAEFAIDEALTESEKQKQKATAPIVRVDTKIEENDPSGLNLTPIDEQTESDWLTADDDPVEPVEQAVPTEQEAQAEPVMPVEETEATLSSIPQEDFSLDSDLNGVSDSATDFEIPMLEDAAMDLDFAELVAPVQEEPFTPCWVIGASLGGPAAVKRFLQSLPADINASFIVVQHIDENFLPVLADILTSNSNFEVKVANGSNMMTAGKIYLAPLKGKLIFLQDGSMLVDHSQKWSEPYSPCIDDVIDSLSMVYKEQSGAIIFSGMGQDGLKGAEIMLSRGGKVWAQSVDTCANSSMPEAIIKADFASVVAPPEMLADRLVEELKQLSPQTVR